MNKEGGGGPFPFQFIENEKLTPLWEQKLRFARLIVTAARDVDIGKRNLSLIASLIGC